VVRSQIANLTFSPSFGHKLCFKCLCHSCKPILDIYVWRAFQWYKELFNPMGFDLYNHSLKIRKSIWSLTPKMGAHLGVWGFIPSHSPTLQGIWNVTPRLHFWFAPLQALALVTNPKLRLQQLMYLKYTPSLIIFFWLVYSMPTLNILFANSIFHDETLILDL
jgi:hypothetical protein